MPDLSLLRERLVGMTLNGGPVCVPLHEQAIGHRALACTAIDDDTLHPVWATLLGLRGMELSFDELFDLAEATVEEGIYFGEAGVELHQDLVAGSTYEVSGRVVDLIRRQGKKAGTFDILTFELDMTAAGGELAATATNSFIFVRGAAS